MEIFKLILEFLQSLMWPVTVVVVARIFRRELRALMGRLTAANLPGGASLQFAEEELSEKIEEAQAIGKKNKFEFSSIPLKTIKPENLPMVKRHSYTEPIKKDIKLYRDLLRNQPIYAITGVFLTTVTMMRNLAENNNVQVEFGGINLPPRQLLNHLSRENILEENQISFFDSLLETSQLATQSMVEAGKANTNQIKSIIDMLENLFTVYSILISENLKENSTLE